MEPDFLYKIVLIGDWGVGKTNILSQYTRGEFIMGSSTTIGVQFSSKSLQISGKSVKVQVWDTAGQDKFRAITSAYYRGAHGALLVYDITRKESFERLDAWVKELKEYVKDSCEIVLLGNKCDLKGQGEVSQEMGLAYAKLNSFAFFETSALEMTNIENAFASLVERIHSYQCQISSEERVAALPGRKLSHNEPLPLKKKTCCG